MTPRSLFAPSAFYPPKKLILGYCGSHIIPSPRLDQRRTVSRPVLRLGVGHRCSFARKGVTARGANAGSGAMLGVCSTPAGGLRARPYRPDGKESLWRSAHERFLSSGTLKRFPRSASVIACAIRLRFAEPAGWRVCCFTPDAPAWSFFFFARATTSCHPGRSVAKSRDPAAHAHFNLGPGSREKLARDDKGG